MPSELLVNNRVTPAPREPIATSRHASRDAVVAAVESAKVQYDDAKAADAAAKAGLKVATESFNRTAQAWANVECEIRAANVALHKFDPEKDVSAIRKRSAEAENALPRRRHEHETEMASYRIVRRTADDADLQFDRAKVALRDARLALEKFDEIARQPVSRFPRGLDGKLLETSVLAVLPMIRLRRIVSPWTVDGQPNSVWRYEDAHAIPVDGAHADAVVDDEDALDAIVRHHRARGSMQRFRERVNDLVCGDAFGPPPPDDAESIARAAPPAESLPVLGARSPFAAEQHARHQAVEVDCDEDAGGALDRGAVAEARRR